MLEVPLLVVVAFSSLAMTATPTPFEVPWSGQTIGPDGPWHVIVAEDGKYKLFPGSTWETWLIEANYCDVGGTETCYAAQSGVYDKDKPQGSDGGISMSASLGNYMLGLNLEGDDATRWVDNLRLDNFEVENTSLALLDNTQRIMYPGGKEQPFFAGCLSLGGSGSVNQSFTRDGVSSAPLTNASLVPGYMWEQGKIPSNSFGMHIGSLQPNLAGSLWFGGYDQNRVVGEVITLDGDFREGITLWDIGIDAIGSSSPFGFDSQDGLLTRDNSTMGRSLRVSIDGCSPYLSLPRSTCDNIASYLPVKFNKSLGLYIWDTSSPEFTQIISSASALYFSFISNSNTDPVKIRVPFMHLNLTLTSPLVESPTAYFPCHVNGKGQYVLGRAYLQDAFIGANWDPRAAKWWMAQAPGRNIQAVPNIATIEPTDESISKGGNDWEASWDGVWNKKVGSATTPTSSTSPTNTPTSEKTVEGGMAIGTKIGVGIGVGVGVLITILGAYFFWRWRRRHNQTSSTHTQSPSTEAKHTYPQEPIEMMGESISSEIQGVSTHNPNYAWQRHELP
ncbi:aspartic peptidase domain-containing protein [Ilyonectria sp. MPI-CAGE-AT-0026]|nr:aspartic peptidase domain-containing protein [Ilyonectria sp. MPI-CAGE-AT-0026]